MSTNIDNITYGLPVIVDEMNSTEQIINQPQVITNYGETPVTVWASAQGCVTNQSGIVYVTEPPQEDSSEKEVFLYAEFQLGDQDRWNDRYENADNQILITDRNSDFQAVLELDAGVPAPTSGKFRLFGSTTKFPDEAWCTDDEIKVVIAFTFTPVFDQFIEDEINQPAENETKLEEKAEDFYGCGETEANDISETGFAPVVLR